MYQGNCHCEKVKWTYSQPIESVTACNCELCRRYGALWAYGHIGTEVEVSGPISSYARGSKRNNYNFCSTCGGLAYYLSNHKDEQGRLRVAVNLRMISNVDLIQNLPIDHFEGKDSFEDLPRDGRTIKDLWF